MTLSQTCSVAETKRGLNTVRAITSSDWQIERVFNIFFILFLIVNDLLIFFRQLQDRSTPWLRHRSARVAAHYSNPRLRTPPTRNPACYPCPSPTRGTGFWTRPKLPRVSRRCFFGKTSVAETSSVTVANRVVGTFKGQGLL